MEEEIAGISPDRMACPTAPLPPAGRIRHAGGMSTPPGDGPEEGHEEDQAGGQAESALARARAEAEAARTQGSSFAVALALTQAGHALLVLGRPDEALTDFSEAEGYLDLLRTDGEHDKMRLLSIASLSLAPPGENLGDLDTLEAWVRVGQAGAFEQLGRVGEAHQAVERARPFTRGWRRRDLRKALDVVADRLARADGTGPAALAASDRAAHDPVLSEAERRQARYEHAALLAEDGRFDEAIRESLTLLRDCDDDPFLEARVRQVLGAALAGTGRTEDALMSLTQAFESFAALGEDRAVALAGPGLASRLSADGQHARAVEVLQRSVTAARTMTARGESDASMHIDLLGALATTLDDAGDSTRAVDVFAQTVAEAEAFGDPVRIADAQHGEAVARARTGNPDEAVEALALLDSARGTYDRTGMTDRAAGCQQEAGALLGRLGSFDAARGRYAAAMQAYGEIPQVLAEESKEARSVAAYNLVVLQSIADGTRSEPPDDAFASGGHAMDFTDGATTP